MVMLNNLKTTDWKAVSKQIQEETEQEIKERKEEKEIEKEMIEELEFNPFQYQEQEISVRQEIIKYNTQKIQEYTHIDTIKNFISQNK
ncbi:hypothetical protein ABPG72_017971 [Tetrahymena utriculariae]